MKGNGGASGADGIMRSAKAWVKRAAELPEAFLARACRVMGILLACSMGVTLGLLIVQGRWREAVPLHLCSVSAIAAAALAFFPGRWLLDYLWYLGMPGAVLALVFPAPAVSRWQAAMSLSYAATHLLILLIPLCTLARGMRPRKGLGLGMMLAMQALAAAAYCVNAVLGTDFLFLSAPPAATPLEGVYRLGYPMYLLTLETLMLLCCMGMERAGRLVFREWGEKERR